MKKILIFSLLISILVVGCGVTSKSSGSNSGSSSNNTYPTTAVGFPEALK
jgi:hypothetical protein